jgi:hypothetical protein
MRQKITDVRERLSRALHDQFAQEVQRSAERIRASIAPYSRFVRAEGERFREIEGELRETVEALDTLRARVEKRAA